MTASNPRDALRVDGRRLWSRLMEIAQYGATPAGGCNRQALTDEDRDGRALFARWCEDALCTVRRDAVGNLFARSPGSDDSLPPVLMGSHLDTQPSGGKFDGVYGVLAGLEVIEALNEAGVQTRHPLEVAVWTNEEGCRFDTAMMGSAVWSGNMPLEAAYALTDRNGASVRDELARTGQLGEHPATSQPVHAAFELHIEQGPVLEAEGLAIGVVTGVQHMSRHRVVIRGQETHAGPSPMALRKDPVMALGDILPRLYQLAEEQGEDSRVTIGFITAEPGSSNTVPGRVEFTVDLRHPDEARYRAMLDGFEEIVQSACDRYSLPHERECFWVAPGVAFDPGCVAAVQNAVDALGYSHRQMVSGAGHDACNVASVAPTSMIFIPCEGGLSHNEAENITPEQAEAGANVLLLAVADRAEITT
ncbi:Zn-dependent hydrolase [Parahaliea mediterranea]|uniref:Zn-dependent hydrolase n=1 Tax=Parahaliea mediterranea TaxID=651086 RepID=A0A939DF26_9GAMM|nr:Zn-dependent hydrolase [Parahaliea mediterranea]MBN7796884.1 Zn-dependent hydrolase [Parahaliea mediterranea]